MHFGQRPRGVRSLAGECRDGTMFLHRPEMSKPKLGEAAAEPHSVLLDEVENIYFFKYFNLIPKIKINVHAMN